MKSGLHLVAALIICVAGAFNLAADNNHYLPGHFSWGVDIGGGIDMSGNDMSTLNLDAALGYRNKALRMLGAGVGINMPVNNSRRTFPVYAIVRTDLTRKPGLCFFDARIGAVFNNMEDDSSKTSLYCAPGIGFNLAQGKTFGSYLIATYIYNGLKAHAVDNPSDCFKGVHIAGIRLGINF